MRFVLTTWVTFRRLHGLQRLRITLGISWRTATSMAWASESWLRQTIASIFVFFWHLPTLCPLRTSLLPSVMPSTESEGPKKKVLRLYLDSSCKWHNEFLINFYSELSFLTLAWSGLLPHLPDTGRLCCFLVGFGCSFMFFPNRVIKYVILKCAYKRMGKLQSGGVSCNPEYTCRELNMFLSTALFFHSLPFCVSVCGWVFGRD